MVTPYDTKENHRKLFYDISGAKMAGVRWQYKGNIGDALTEFAEISYVFDIGKIPKTFDEITQVMRNHPRDHSRNYIVTEENVPLHKVMEIITHTDS